MIPGITPKFQLQALYLYFTKIYHDTSYHLAFLVITSIFESKFLSIFSNPRYVPLHNCSLLKTTASQRKDEKKVSVECVYSISVLLKYKMYCCWAQVSPVLLYCHRRSAHISLITLHWVYNRSESRQ